MTVSTQTTKVDGLGNGSATLFSFAPMEIFRDTEITVVHVDASGTETPLSQGTGPNAYAVVAAVGSYPAAPQVTGSVRYPEDAVTPMPNGEKITMKRVMTLEQETDLTNQGGYFADTQEAQFDRLVMIDLQQQEDIDRSLRGPISDTTAIGDLPSASARASKFLGFDATGEPIAATTITTSPVTAFAATVLDDVDAPAARATLDAQEDVITTRGDLVVGNATPAASRLAVGAVNRVLRSDGTDPVWGQVATADIEDDAISRAKIAHQTAGQLPYYGASGVPSLLNIGSTDDVLTVVGGVPVWQAIAGWSAWSSLDLSNGGANDTSQWDFLTGQSGLSEIEFFIEEHSPSTAAILEMVLGDSGGFELTGYNGHAGSDINGTTSGLANSTEFSLHAATHAAAAVVGGRGKLQHLGSNKWAFSFHGHGSAGTNDAVHIASGTKTLTTELTQVRLQVSAGNFTNTGAALLWYRTL